MTHEQKGFRTRNPLVQLVLIALAAILGIGSRRYAHVLPRFIAAHAGDTLVGAGGVPGHRVVPAQSINGNDRHACDGVLCRHRSQPVYHAPWIDSIRQTTLGGLILGFGFLWSDLACYAAGVGLGVILELIVLAARNPSRS